MTSQTFARRAWRSALATLALCLRSCHHSFSFLDCLDPMSFNAQKLDAILRPSRASSSDRLNGGARCGRALSRSRASSPTLIRLSPRIRNCPRHAERDLADLDAMLADRVNRCRNARASPRMSATPRSLTESDVARHDCAARAAAARCGRRTRRDPRSARRHGR